MCLFLLSSESIDNGVCFTEGSFLPLWLWISFTSTLSIPSLSTSFSVLFNPSSSPPFSCSSHSRSHTGDAWIGGSPDQCCRSPSSAEGRAQTQSRKTQIRKYWRSLQYHEKEKHLKEDFLQPMDICQKCWRQGQSHFITREVWWEWKLFVDYFEECKASNWDFVFKSLKTLTEEDPPERNIYSKPHWKKKKLTFL